MWSSARPIGCSWGWRLATAPFHYNSARAASTRAIDYRAIDEKWQQRWANAPKSPPRGFSSWKDEFTVLPMFPYPSGTLHLGHFRVYTISDVLARFKRMQGYNVLHAMGWDAFGLPAENAAIERGINPAKWTLDNILKMKEQIKTMGGKWDWDRELMTCDPAFYKQTQRLFLQLHEKGLAYQAESEVNYDPIDLTVLANEQVDANGYSWRSGAKVEKRRLKQWFLRITAFKEALLEDLELLRGDWPDHVLTMQENWLGRSAGLSIDFALSQASETAGNVKAVSVFTTRADTLFGAQYIALALNHPLVQETARTMPQLQEFLEDPKTLESDSKTGFLLPHITAVNPLGAISGTPSQVQKPLPVFVAPYVLGEYGTGAVMGVPGHDTRDYEFWQTNQTSYPALVVVEPSTPADVSGEKRVPFTDTGILNQNCGDYAGLLSSDAILRILKDLKPRGEAARQTYTWRLRDWLISRQRYWGAPIPIVHCESCGAVPVPDDQLPVELPSFPDGRMKRESGNPLENNLEWVNTSCPICAQPAKRETDTMDTFVDSSWYYMRFADHQSTRALISPEMAAKWMPVNTYVGGVEHAILHLLYSRFIYKFLLSHKPLSDEESLLNFKEPFQKLVAQGMVHGKTFSNPKTGRFLKPEDIDHSNADGPKIIATGEDPLISFEKMSKSKYNGVDPSVCIAKYGADANRAHMLFQAPVHEIVDWDESRIVGIQRWFGRIWLIANELSATDWRAAQKETPGDTRFVFANAEERMLWRSVQETISSVATAFDQTIALNTTVSDLMTLTGKIHGLLFQEKPATTKDCSKTVLYHSFSALLRMLAPIAPAFAEECWELIHMKQMVDSQQKLAIPLDDHTNSIFYAGFPETDGSLERLQSDAQPCAIQVNGRLRMVCEIAVPPPNLAGEELKEFVLSRAFVVAEVREATYKGRSLKTLPAIAKKIVVARHGRTLNIVIDESGISNNENKPL